MRPERPAARWLVWLAIMLLGTTAAAAQPAPKDAIWRVTVRQIDAQGAQVGKPSDFTCPRSGCEQAIQLDVLGKPYQFLIAITAVPAGVYVALQSLTPEVKGVFGFEQGYVGPVFVRLLQGRRVIPNPCDPDSRGIPRRGAGVIHGWRSGEFRHADTDSAARGL